MRAIVAFVVLLALPSCAWLKAEVNSPTGQAVINCAEAGLKVEVEKLVPDVFMLLEQAAAGKLTLNGLVAALGGLEALTADGIATVSCAVDAAVLLHEGTPAPASQVKLQMLSQPTIGSVAAKLGRMYLGTRHRTIKRP